MLNGEIFRQYDIRGVVGKDLTNDVLYQIGLGFGTYLRNLNNKTVVIGGDARLSTPEFKDHFIRGLLETGCDVTDVGIVGTPVLYYSIWKLSMEGGVMITASHNPSQYNGIKLNLGQSSVYAEALQDVLKIIQAGKFASGKGKLVKNKAMPESYINYIVGNIKFARSVKVIVDAGNGMGGLYLPPILRKLGCDVTEMFCQPDGNFPNHHPDPTIEKNNIQLAKAVLEQKAELGIGLDGDADRIGVVDENGRMLFGDQILNILARDFLKENFGGTVIVDVKCSKNLFDDLRKRGGKVIMYKTGHANIKNYMKQIGVKFAGEMSGHIFMADRYLGYDDAIYASCRFIEIVSKTNQPVSKYLADEPQVYNTPELHIDCADDRKFDVVAKVCQSFKDDGLDVNDIDGARITFPDGWGLIRASNTTPVLVLRFEAETRARMLEIQKLVEDRLKQYM
jgi:phosphomannomutase / phosphoglucomutase